MTIDRNFDEGYIYDFQQVCWGYLVYRQKKSKLAIKKNKYKKSK